MSYAKLTGGLGIQWPCNAQYPNGKPRLHDDGKYLTKPKTQRLSGMIWNSLAHLNFSGTPISPADYAKMNQNGRAILKINEENAKDTKGP
ncbi:hypothetical protein QFC21_003019 [Naganishia friedmannii]|uniref:Uncharacterized protein n=1 Tax=Naganishia friedmannii TaxID=89922 RepID=A0ACC2VSR4_9TREE|nr:hypothetical protein QFC21_003019 [Naganishia friedmannii]